MKILCPVCGCTYQEPALLWSICPSCDTQFGLSDSGRTHAQLRSMWIEEGAKWSSPVVPKPAGWSPLIQLRAINYVPTPKEFLVLNEIAENKPLLASTFNLWPLGKITVSVYSSPTPISNQLSTLDVPISEAKLPLVKGIGLMPNLGGVKCHS